MHSDDIAPTATCPAPEEVKEQPLMPPALLVETDARPTLDRVTFDELADVIGADGMRATFDVFTAETVVRLQLLRRLSCDDERVRIRDEAHTLKGASGTLGLSQVCDLARTLERSAPTIAPADYVDIVGRLDAYFQTARHDVELALAGLATAA